MYVLIHNPHSRSFSPERLAYLEEFLTLHGYNVVLKPTNAPGHATFLAREALKEKAQVILAAGGDGTVREVASGMLGSFTPLGIFPSGTANVLAHALNYPSSDPEIVEILLQGHTQRISAGKVEFRKPGEEAIREAAFLLMAGVGLDARICREVSLPLKKILGEGAYALSALKNILTSLAEFDVHANTEVALGHTFIALNSPFYGGPYPLGETAGLTSSELEGILVRDGVMGILKTFAELGKGNLPSGHHILRTIGNHFQIHKQGVPIQVDGDYIGESPCTVSLVPDSLSLILPG